MVVWTVVTHSPNAAQGAEAPPAGGRKADVNQADVNEGTVLAWIRFEKGIEEVQEYEGVPYIWLGRAEIHLTIDVEPRPGHVLKLSWGSKNDTREAAATINGRPVLLRQGGYNGFRPLRVPVPGTVAALRHAQDGDTELVEGVAAQRYEITLRQTHGKAAFIAAVRLLARDAPARRGGKAAAQPDLALSKPAHRISLRTTAATRPDAFPEMRAIWDEPASRGAPLAGRAREAAFRRAERNARRANESFFRSRRFIDGWLAHADPETGLIPRNLGGGRDIWNAKDAAADNYPFMVLAAAITDRPLFEGRMLDMLRTETRLTSRIDRLPDTWSFSRRAFSDAEPDLGRIIFGGSEYVKDGLLPLTEWLGESPWSERMIGIIDDIWKHAPVKTPYGRIPSTNVEVNGEMLQALSRVYWMSGEGKYLGWAIRLGDYYLLGGHHPTRDFRSLRLRDHGSEIVSGLCELYAAVRFAAPDKRKAYREPVHAMCDRILEVGRNEHGMLYNSIDPETGEHSEGICDTWGYNYNGIYTVYLIDGTEAYRRAVLHVLGNLNENYRNYKWEGSSSDGYADSIESALNLYNREPVPSVAEWLDSEIGLMWSNQRPDGVIEGWHGDGNSARTGVMYALWKTQGMTIRPWRLEVRFGAARDGAAVCVSLCSEVAWTGKLLFDKPRHRVQMGLPLDYPRINQFPEWFTPEADERYTIRDVTAGSQSTFTGGGMQAGIPVELRPAEEMRLLITPAAR